MKIHTVITPANIEIDYRLAGAGSRLAAFVIDFTIQIIVCLLIAFVILFGIYDYRFANWAEIESLAIAFLIISWFVVYFCYFIAFEMWLNGQSIGKKIFGLRVIRDNGLPVGLIQSVIRNLFKAVLDVLYIGLFFILFSKQHKRIGDMVAGTVVVCEHYDSIGTPLRSAQMPDSNRDGLRGRMPMEQLGHLILSLEEKNLLHLYMARKIYLPDHASRDLHSKWADYLAQKWNIEPALIDSEILSGILQINESEY